MGCFGFFIVLVLACFALAGMIRWLFLRVQVIPGEAKLLTECVKCHYSLAGLGTSPSCPECGTPHASIYTTKSRKEWLMRYDLFWHWVWSALLCLAIWWLIAYAFPPILTAAVYLSHGWDAAPRVTALMNSVRYPWNSEILAMSLLSTWLACAALARRWGIRSICIAAFTLLVSVLIPSTIDGFSGHYWNGDWYTFFWDQTTEVIPGRIFTVSLITFVVCAGIDLYQWSLQDAPKTT